VRAREFNETSNGQRSPYQCHAKPHFCDKNRTFALCMRLRGFLIR